MNMCNNRITYHVVQDIRREAFAKLEILPLKYIDSHPTATSSAVSWQTWISFPTAC